MVWHYQPACDSPWIVWKRKGIGAEDRPVCHGLQPELQTFLLASDCRVNSGEDPPSVRIYFWDRTLARPKERSRRLFGADSRTGKLSSPFATSRNAAQAAPGPGDLPPSQAG